MNLSTCSWVGLAAGGVPSFKDFSTSVRSAVLGFKAAAAAANVSRHDSKGGGKYPKGVATVGGGTALLGINEGIKSDACLCLILDLGSLLWLREWWLDAVEWWLGDFVWLDEEVLDEDFAVDEVGGVADVVLEGVAWDQS